MENCKISEAEADRVLVKRVNNRPNAMATYGMAKMSPTDTKDIFDKQFALVKEKHNLLVEKTADIYQEQERMSEQVSDHSEWLNDLEDKIDKIQVPDSNIPEWALQPEKPSYSKGEVGLGNVDNVKQYSASNPPPYPVTSVNGQGGNVSLGAADVGAMPAGTKIPAKTSDITNDSGFITKVVSDLANYYTKSQTFTRDEINAKISAIPKFAISVVSSLPTSNISVTTVYLVGGGSGNDLYTEYIYANGKWEILGAQTVDLTGYATETWVITQLGDYIKQSELEAAIESALASIPDWAKSSEKPTYSKSEVGLNNVDNVRQYSASNPPPYPVTSVNKKTGDVTVTVPSKTSELENDSGFIKSSEAPVQSVNGKSGDVTLVAEDVGARPSTWTPTYSDVGADKSGAASSAVSSHNTNTSAHNDIRLLIEELTTRLNALANSTDSDLDQMAEIVAYIKSNKTLIDSITSSKVSVADIVNNLTSNVANKPLSAAQGVVLKALIDAITVPTKVSQLTNDKGYLTSYTETDPTVPSWAKQSSKPRYNANEVGAVAYTAQNLTEEQKAQARANIGALDKSQLPTITQEAGESESLVMSQKATTNYVVAELAKRGQLAPEYANSIEECTDTSKMYVLPDGMIWAYMLTEKEVSSGGGYTNLLPLAVQSDGKTLYVGDNGEKGYRSNYRVSSSGVEKSATDYYATGFITVKQGDTVRIKGMSGTDGSGYCVAYFGTQATIPWVIASAASPVNGLLSLTADANNVRTFSVADANALYMRLTFKGNPDDIIITVNEEIVEGGGTEIVTEYDWANTGLAFVPADYEDRIVDLESEVSQNSADIENLKKGVTTSTPIKDWDSPIYDANIPVFELSAEKTAMTNAPCTPSDIYAKYDALMVKHPRYIKKTDLGLCSDGVNHVYRYDFREPEPLHESNKEWSETKAKAIIVTGIHFEWAGIYAMYNALEEVADNPTLRNFRRNTHLIVVPCCNPYATIANNYQSGLSTPNSYGVRNANGVEIHRNFEVDWVLTEAGTTHYGGAEPLSEVETQYIDNIMKNNTDAALFLSCHNCGVDTFWGTGFIWASTATKHMCNMGYRVIDKLSDAWMDKYGDTLSTGIAEYKTSALSDGETRLGWTGLSTSPGTEAKQATKYGIQGTNVEICDPFQIHGTKANPEPSMSSFTMSRGAEVYVNFLLTAFGVYDPKDKALYGGNQ